MRRAVSQLDAAKGKGGGEHFITCLQVSTAAKHAYRSAVCLGTYLISFLPLPKKKEEFFFSCIAACQLHEHKSKMALRAVGPSSPSRAFAWLDLADLPVRVVPRQSTHNLDQHPFGRIRLLFRLQGVRGSRRGAKRGNPYKMKKKIVSLYALNDILRRLHVLFRSLRNGQFHH